MSFGRNSWLGTEMPSAALVVTAVGSTCRSIGKFLRPAVVGKTYFCAANVFVVVPESGHTATVCGRFQSALIVTIAFPDASRSEERRVGKECRSRWSPYH